MTASPSYSSSKASPLAAPYAALRWHGDAATGSLILLDQTRLPGEIVYRDCTTVEHVWDAIKRLQVRGAPAIGAAAAYGVVVGCQLAASHSRAVFDQRLGEVTKYLAGSRPTAVNLFWALERMRRFADGLSKLSPTELLQRLLGEADALAAEDREMCAAIGRHGAPLMPLHAGVLTHCNTGALATAGEGTAFGVLLTAHRQGRGIQVYADETRPLLQGARLTMWELMQHQVPCTLITDSMAGWVMRKGLVSACIVGADRITARGDTANKIGTYSVAQLAKAHGLPFYVAAPSSTFDLTLNSGDDIPIEERDPAEIVTPGGVRFAPPDCRVFNPAFDVTPAELITAIITERGVIQPVTPEQIRAVLGPE